MVSERFDETKISIDTDDKLSIDITLKKVVTLITFEKKNFTNYSQIILDNILYEKQNAENC